MNNKQQKIVHGNCNAAAIQFSNIE